MILCYGNLWQQHTVGTSSLTRILSAEDILLLKAHTITFPTFPPYTLHLIHFMIIFRS